MNRHTAGKWVVTGWKIGQIKNQFEITVITGENIAGSLEMQENVNLVESVHELLEALEDLVRINEQHNSAIQSVTGKPAGWKDDYLNQARAAIAKARGEAQ